MQGNEEALAMHQSLGKTEQLLLDAIARVPEMTDIRMRYEITKNYSVFLEEVSEYLEKTDFPKSGVFPALDR